MNANWGDEVVDDGVDPQRLRLSNALLLGCLEGQHGEGFLTMRLDKHISHSRRSWPLMHRCRSGLHGVLRVRGSRTGPRA